MSRKEKPTRKDELVVQIKVDCAFQQDRALAQRASRGDREAQGEIIARLLPQIRGLSRMLMAEVAEADDLEQQALLTVLRQVADYRGDGPLEHWAGRVAARCAGRLHRQRKLQNRNVPLESVANTLEGNFRLASLPATTAQVRELLAQVSEEQRAAVVLRHVAGCSIEEIAEITEVSPNTIKDRLLRGRRVLRRFLQREHLFCSDPVPLERQA